MRFLLLLITGEFVLFFFIRRVNLDEGWYLGAAQLVYRGKTLYADFAYTQTPLLPYVYGFFLQFTDVGLYQGRLLTIGLAGIACWLSAATAYRLGGAAARLFCLALLATSFFALSQYTYTATYALTACLIAVAVYIALLGWPADLRNGLATAFVCLAVCTRLSTVVILPPFLLYLLLSSERKWRAFWVIGLTTAVTLGLILGSFWLRDSELMRYDIWGFHLDRILRTRWQVLKIRSRIIRTAIDFAVPIGLTVWAAFWAIRRFQARLQRNQTAQVSTVALHGTERSDSDSSGNVAAMLLTLISMIASLFVAHLVPRTTDSYYNALQLPLMAIAGSVVLSQWISYRAQQQRRGGRGLWIGLLVVGLLLHGALQVRAVLRDDTLNLPPRNQIAVVRETARIVQQYVPPDLPILTFNQHLAIEAKRTTPPGYEMSIFAYRPTWEKAQANAYKVINNELLLEDLARPMALAAFTEFDLGQIYGERDAFFAILNYHYRWFYTIDHFGPYGDTLYLYVPPQFLPQPPQYAYPSTFADNIALLGYDLAFAEQGGLPVLDVALYWQADEAAAPTQAYTAFVQLLDPNGNFAAGFDNPPCHRTCPTDTWQPGEFLRDEYRLALAGVVPGEYQLQIGLYDANGTRLKVLTGPFADEDRILLTDVLVE